MRLFFPLPSFRSVTSSSWKNKLAYSTNSVLQCCGIGTVGTVTFCRCGTGTGTVISQTQYQIVYLISFISTFFSFTFYNKFDATYQFFPLNRKKSYGSATLVLCRLLLRNITYGMHRNSVFYTKRYLKEFFSPNDNFIRNSI